MRKEILQRELGSNEDLVNIAADKKWVRDYLGKRNITQSANTDTVPPRFLKNH